MKTKLFAGALVALLAAAPGSAQQSLRPDAPQPAAPMPAMRGMQCGAATPAGGGPAGMGCGMMRGGQAGMQGCGMMGGGMMGGATPGQSMPGMAAPRHSGDESAPSLALRAAVDKMHRDMAIAYSGDADLDFVKGMIAHHQAAVDMSKIVIAFGKDKEVRKTAEEIAKTQETEIDFLREWLRTRQR